MSGRVVLVVGGSRGIGLACARRFQRDGDRVVVTYVNAPPELQGESGAPPLLALRCDVTDAAAVDGAFDEIEAQLGPVEVLVFCAGITDDTLLMRMSEERWSKVLDTNLSGAYRAARRAVSAMAKARRGRIIFMSSVVGFMGNAGQTNYAATKAGLIGLGRSLAREVARRQVTVNVVAPGLVDTDMLGQVPAEQRAELEKQVPLGRIATPEEVAAAVHFLASEEASYLTGVVLSVDGGLGMGN